MRKFQFYLLLFSLYTIGFGLFFYKFYVLGFPLSEGSEVDIWNVEAHITFDAQNEPAKISFFIPQNTQNFLILSENFVSKGYGLSTSTVNTNRQAIWGINRAEGRQDLYYIVEVNKIKFKKFLDYSPPSQLKQHGFEGHRLLAAEALLSDVQARSADIDSLVVELLKRFNNLQHDKNVEVLLGEQYSIERKLELITQILALSDIHARIVNGIELKELVKEAKLIQWLEVYTNYTWKSYGPFLAKPGIPDDYFAWWRGNDPLVQLAGGNNLHVNISVGLKQREAINAAIKRGEIINPWLLDFSLFSLPIHTQIVYHMLFLIPVGAFLIVFLRNIIGIETFGTFMPILIALSFRETHLLWGIILFSLLAAIGLAIRLYLEYFKILVVPRLTFVLTVVILSMAVLSILFQKLGIEHGLYVAIFPMVILTMTIERMSIIWEERGASVAIRRGIWSLAAAALAYFFMFNTYVKHVTFIFPEILFIILASTLILGRYSGYRLFELFRFKELVND
ncbi:MAG: inactive transglutaminase family protein [Candidatus Kuenenia sp.]|nr:inactive transglutaminase family protein [Candidatus Kuenenia hertensis]